ncbi:hypothetical protein HJG60_008343 [Phyllostomus discolor]|uniref:Uncharacterized protein n=1 Tax=Phyllostomus discolor TaxID=89673 RepID=A0A833ZB72_9CHIR|nr:hypothetical protein HJG60_008343 [Phyllostomus discolor]
MMPQWPPERRLARGHVFSLLRGVYPAVEFLGHTETPGLTFGGAACRSSNVAASAGAPTGAEEGFHRPLAGTCYLSWVSGRPRGRGTAAHRSLHLDLHLPADCRPGASFPVLPGRGHPFPGGTPTQILCPL